MIDITILTDQRYTADAYADPYSQNVVDEDRLLKEALESLGFSVFRTSWDDREFDWSTTRFILFRTTWDYFDRFQEFSKWLDHVNQQTQLINPKDLIYWNLDKFYLKDLQDAGIHIPPTLFIEKQDNRSLMQVVEGSGWDEVILKPAVAGGARHTYRFKKENAAEFNSIHRELIENERMLLQEFQKNILDQGEVSLMVFGGTYSHSVLKKAKPGDFRVQDDWGGTLHDYTPSGEDIELAERAIRACDSTPVYARVDIMWGNDGKACVGELELIEPELWFRRDIRSAERCAVAIQRYLRTFSADLTNA